MRRHTRPTTSRNDRSALLVVLGCVGLTLALLTAALKLPTRPAAPAAEADNVPASVGATPLDDAPFADELTASASGEYPVYRHSVVAGGVHSQQDVARVVNADPVVREHYSHVSVANLKVARTSARREAYMSYRIGDRVYWTSKKIALADGEAVLTDGETTIRARCGNLVSDEAMAPTSEQEPPSVAFDAVDRRPAAAGAALRSPSAVAGAFGSRDGEGTGPAVTGTGTGIGTGAGSGAGILGPAGTALSQGEPGGSVDGDSIAGSGGVGGPGGIVTPGGGSPGSPSNEGGSNDPSLTAEQGSNPPNSGNPSDDNPPTVGGGPSGGDGPGSNPPGSGNPPGFDIPPGLGPPAFNPPGFGDGPGPVGGDPPPGFGPPIVIESPPASVPVPEPASLLLLGTGLALTAWSARRRRSKHKSSSRP